MLRRTAIVLLVPAALVSACAERRAPASPTRATPVVAGGTAIPRYELQRRVVGFADHQSFSPVPSVRPYVTRLVIDERWAVRDAAAAGLVVSEREIDAALEQTFRDFATRTRLQVLELYGATPASLRERVRGELSARALADEVLRTTAGDAHYGGAFHQRARRRRAATRCLRPWVAADRCAGYHPGGRGERWIEMGVGRLTPTGLELDLAPLLEISSDDPERDYRLAAQRLRRAVRRSSPAVERRVRISSDSLEVYASGSRADLIAVARVAHRLALGHPVPVLQ